MTAPSAAAASKFVLGAAVVAGLALVGCTGFYEIPIETPIQPKMDVTAFQRVLVAGFISGGSDDVDANLETVRLLRSQLRTKSPLRVIEAEVLPLAEIAAAESAAARDSNAITTTSEGVAPVGPIPAAEMAKPAESAARPQDPHKADPSIRNEKDLAKYDKIFADVAYWKKLGEEYQTPLIVTGTVLFTPNQANGFVMQQREVYDSFGRRSVIPVRTYQERKGFILQPRFVFIDGRTGAILYSETFHEEILYPSQQSVPALSTYFELMDRVMPSFLSTLSAQKIRGTRVLLK
jgi:outer membrane murein-binding lipoprotein Lpp